MKYSSLHKNKNGSSTYWQFRTKGEQDFIVAFLEKECGLELQDPIILLVPMQFLDEQKELHISQSGPWLKEFQIEPEELYSFLKEYASLRKEGLF